MKTQTILNKQTAVSRKHLAKEGYALLQNLWNGICAEVRRKKVAEISPLLMNTLLFEVGVFKGTSIALDQLANEAKKFKLSVAWNRQANKYLFRQFIEKPLINLENKEIICPQTADNAACVECKYLISEHPVYGFSVRGTYFSLCDRTLINLED